MSNEDDRLLLHALADGELDAAAALRLGQQLAGEPALAAEYEQIATLKRAVASLERPVVSDDFYARMAALAPATAVGPAPRRSAGMFSGDWRAMAASLVLVAVLASSGTYLLIAPPRDASVAEAIIGGHRRSLLAGSPVDVASSDRHTVRPWFDAKLGVSPPAPDLAAAGFPLVGGRVDVVGAQTVPTLVYRHDKHLITVVALPQAAGRTADSAPKSSSVGGYNVVRWSRDGFGFWAVSDLDAAELDALVTHLQTK